MGLLAAVVAGGLYWETYFRAVNTDYDVVEHGHFVVDYPEGWQVSLLHNDDGTGVTVTQPQEVDGLELTVVPWAQHDGGEDATQQLANAASDIGSGQAYAEFDHAELDPSELQEWPGHWDVAAVELTFTRSEGYLNRHPEVEESDWFEIWLQVHVDNRISYTLSWLGPQQERVRYAEVIDDTLGSFHHDP